MRCNGVSFAQTFEIAGEWTTVPDSKGQKYAKIPDDLQFIGNSSRGEQSLAELIFPATMEQKSNS
jgi:hypothetical protein